LEEITRLGQDWEVGEERKGKRIFVNAECMVAKQLRIELKEIEKERKGGRGESPEPILQKEGYWHMSHTTPMPMPSHAIANMTF